MRAHLSSVFAKLKGVGITVHPREPGFRSVMSPNSDLYCELAEIPVYSGAQFILSPSKDVRKASDDGEFDAI